MSKEFKEFTREEVQQHNKPGDLWIVVDANVYDLSRFADLHPGGRAVLVDSAVAGQDATEAFYGLHRHEVLERSQYARLRVGVLKGEKSVLVGRVVGGLSGVPYAEPTYLSKGFHSPYYSENHKAFQKVVRKFFDENVYPDAQERELDGKRPSQEVFDKMAQVNLHAMRLGPGKHLKGLSLFHGLVKPEEFDYFHELIITQEIYELEPVDMPTVFLAVGSLAYHRYSTSAVRRYKPRSYRKCLLLGSSFVLRFLRRRQEAMCWA